jgi:uncharacterized membrane protein YqjE
MGQPAHRGTGGEGLAQPDDMCGAEARAQIRYAAGMVTPEVPEQSVSELVHGLTEDVRQLVTDEVALAKAELKAALRRAIRVAIGAAVALLGTAVFLIFALVALVEWLPNHTLVAGVIAAAGLLLLLLGPLMIWRNRRLWPFKETKASLEEDLEWARRLSKRVKP